MDNEKLFFSKKELITVINDRLKENEEDIQSLLKKYGYLNEHQLREKNIEEFNDIDYDNYFLNSLLKILSPKKKKKIEEEK